MRVARRGPKPVPRKRITVNLPQTLMAYVMTLPGRSVSARITFGLQQLQAKDTVVIQEYEKCQTGQPCGN
jgi:hypothetical protein